MVKKQQSKRQRNIKSKLMAAICMLLVSTIMMVSSTYAWFTLSTAPEVTGITTAVGANGNLEMALVPLDGDLTKITSEVGDSLDGPVDRNTSWGNLVDLDHESYGLESIVLYPSALNETSGKINTASVLSYPKYGADGRVESLASDVSVGVYTTTANGSGFYPSSNSGVRAVGAVSGMTERQSAYRTALATANGAMADAKNTASNTLNTYGSTLASIAMTHGMDANGNATFTQTDINAVASMISGLETSLSHVEMAYRQYILAIAASAATGTEDAGWIAMTALVNGSSSLSELATSLDSYIGELPAVLTTGVALYEASVSDVALAKGAMPSTTKDSYLWSDFGGAVGYLMDSSKMTVNEFTIAEVKENPSKLVSSAMSNGLTLTIGTGGGVFADIADQCGDYTASINMNIDYNGLTLENMTATMKTKTTVTTVYLNTLKIAANNAGYPASSSNANQPISEMYGYIIDMAFRTNAAASNLLLQQEAVDRIYEGNNNEDTMGHGSSMTFAGAADLTTDQVEDLMECIRIVFFEPSTGNIMARAKLNMNDTDTTADGITAPMYIYEATTGTTETTYYTDGNGNYTDADGNVKVYVDKSTGTTKYYSDEEKKTELSEEDAFALRVVQTQGGTTSNETVKSDNVIMALTQNDETALSVLVYLDGASITNGSVSASGSNSMKGTMNLQFASSANLVPMEYAGLHTNAGSGNNNQATTYTVNATPAGGVTNLVASATKGTDYSFTVADGYSLTGVTIGGTAYSDYTNSGSTYTIPGAAVTGNIAITVTAD